MSITGRKKIKKSIGELYQLIVNEEDARVCRDISDDACNYVPVNFFIIFLSLVFTKLGDALSNPKTVLAWLMSYVNAPVYLIGFLVPIRESGSLIPQLFIAGYIRRLPKRKWIWVLGSVLQFAAIAAIGIIGMTLKGVSAGYLIILCLIIFSLSRGLASISSKDVIGKTIPKTRRGRLSGLSASVSGVLTMGAGVYLLFQTQESQSPDFYGALVFAAAFLWLAASIIFSFLTEQKGETAGGGNAFTEGVKQLKLLKDDKPFRQFVITRSLLLCTALTAPYYIVLAQDQFGEKVYLLGLFILANGIASSMSAFVWGKMADDSSRRVMILSALIAGILGVIVFIIANFIPSVESIYWVYPAAFFVLGIAHSGVRLGRKTYIVDMAGGNKRTDYVAVSNTVIGFILLLTGLIGLLASIISPSGVILLLSLFGFAGVITAKHLPDVE